MVTSRINKMKSVVSDNDIEINRFAQYNRSSFILEISEISCNKNENVSNIIKKVIMLTVTTGFNITQVPVAHRISKRENTPIIILFNKKSDRNYFYKPKKKFQNLRAHQFQATRIVDEEVTFPGNGKEQVEETIDNEVLMFLNESLTRINRRLLKGVEK